jgi:peptidoglycan/LPS O-acetylase OafA/YrhL
MKRLLWLDVAKGLAIVWIVYFHLFLTYTQTPSPIRSGFISKVAGADGWGSLEASAVTIAKLTGITISQLGFHAVGVFIIMSGWALMQSTARRAEKGPVAWGAWYRARFIRLYPMYWVAHLVYLVSPFVARMERVDERIILSLLGLRFINIDMNFAYLNAAWWYFSMLIQLYLLFPIFFVAMRRLGAWPLLLIACALGFFARYLLLVVYPQNGSWAAGGFAICRLPEFALGMAFGAWHARRTPQVERLLLGGAGLATGLLLYPAALWLYRSLRSYVFVDFATGACCFLVLVGVAGVIMRLKSVAKLLGLVGAFSYGIYLVHQPYVIWLGLRIKEQPVWMFLLIAAAAIAVLSAWGMLLEKTVNALVAKLVGAKKIQPPPAIQPQASV